MISPAQEIIGDEMDTAVKGLTELADVTEQSVIGAVIENFQKVRDTAPVFYDLVRTAS